MKKTIPNIRFEGYFNDWEQRKLSELYFHARSGGTPKSTNAKYYNGEIPFLSISDITKSDGYIKSTEKHITKKGLDNSSAWVVPAGAISLAMYASVGKLAILKIDVATSQAFYNMVFSSDTIRDFIYQRLSKTYHFGEWNSLVSTGTQANLNADKVKEFLLKIPNSQYEIELVASLFIYIDNNITLLQRELKAYETLKKTMLNLMFPDQSEVKPTIRFAGFTDDWVQRKLEDLAESFNYGLNASAMEFDGENKYIRITDIDEQSHKFIQSGLTSPNTDLLNADDYLLKEGDILFARTGASVGKSYQYEPLDGKVYYAGFLIRARIKPEFDPRFIFQNTLTKKYNNFIKVTSQRSGQPGVNAQEYANFSILIPSRGEQVKLGNFFKQVDDTIALHQRKLQLMEMKKKYFLKEMFI